LTRRLFAFVGIEDSHFTLNIVLNDNWREPKLKPLHPKWMLFHFDSLRTATRQGEWTLNLKNAKGFALWALDIRDKDKLDIFDTPVPQQASASNDCGLFAAHFLRVFLNDIQKSRDFCIQVSFYLCVNPMLIFHQFMDAPCNRKEVREFWDEERLPVLRDEGVRIFDFYKAIDDLIKGGQIYPNYVDVVHL
jgi:Ulp1 family protease